MNETVRELTMLLLYLNAWEEKNPLDGEIFLRSWKGYDFDVLNELNEVGMIYDDRKAKSVLLTSAGEAYAKKLLASYGLSDNAEDKFDRTVKMEKTIASKAGMRNIPVIYQMEAFPEKIKIEYSKTMDKSYPMNICRHCGAIQGKNFVYRDINDYIYRMLRIDIVK
jgi:hypothetical protein